MHAFPRKVVASAIIVMFPDSTTELLIGVRHWDPIMSEQYGMIKAYRNYRGINSDRIEEDQGFIDQWGKFMSREEAMQVVKDSGQPFDEARNGYQSKELYSEGVW